MPDVKTGLIQITPHRGNIPTQSLAIVKSVFKGFIPLTPGQNEIKLLYFCPHAKRPFTSFFYCTYVPLLQNPPLKLVIIAGSDSECTYDDVPEPRHPATLETAIKKLRLAGYLWASYTGSEMAHAGLGQRSFRLDEAWLPDSISRQSETTTVTQQTAKIQVLRSKYSVAEIRNPERAQQNHAAGSAGSLFDIALQTIRETPTLNGPKEHIAALFIDAHFDTTSGLITGHAALGGGTAQHSLAIFGSHSLFSWPTCLEEIESCFTDETEVDKRYCGVDGEGRRYFAACNVGIGAMMHEVGHLFGCPHQESGVMLRDYVRLHRSLTALEPTHADSVVGAGSCHWHRLDLLRFLGHASFLVPEDHAKSPGGVTCLGVEAGLSITSPSGIKVVEIYLAGHEFPKTWIETNGSSSLVVTEKDLRARLNHAQGNIKINIIAETNESLTVNNIADLLVPETVPGIGHVWKSPTFGIHEGASQRILLPPAVNTVRVFSGACLDGLEFLTGSARSVSEFGMKGGSPSDFKLMPDEYIVGFNVRSGAWIDALQIITNRRVSPMCGNAHGGGLNTLQCPAGYRVCGIFGQVGNWVVQFGMLYTRM